MVRIRLLALLTQVRVRKRPFGGSVWHPLNDSSASNICLRSNSIILTADSTGVLYVILRLVRDFFTQYHVLTT